MRTLCQKNWTKRTIQKEMVFTKLLCDSYVKLERKKVIRFVAKSNNRFPPRRPA